MARIPPNLLYLTIYNPTLKPNTDSKATQLDSGEVIDDEDAEEQAHILFYTSKERAVSRDRMLRQVGLAKALVNFAEMFTIEDFCDNIHSQSRRMVMVSPEPDFHIHACIEVAKIPRPPVDKAKTVKAKGNDKSKIVTNGTDKEPLYDYIDGSVHDTALQASIMDAYDRFKLTHGSFSTILATLGKQALELQLERFWTIWAWSWDLEEGLNFEDLLGPPLHPYHASLAPVVDNYTSQLGQDVPVLILQPPYSIPSTTYLQGQHPPSLAQYLLSLVPPKPPQPPPPPVTKDTPTKSSTTDSANPATAEGSNGTFLGIPPVNKWGWPGYLTFGRSQTKNGNATPPASSSSQENTPPKSLPDHFIQPPETGEKREETTPQQGLQVQTADLAVNQGSSEDAISSQQPTSVETTLSAPLLDAVNGKEESTSVAESLLARVKDPSRSSTPSAVADPPEAIELPKFSVATVHLGPIEEPSQTSRQVVHYLALREQGLMLAILSPDHELLENESTVVNALALCKEVQDVIDERETKSLSDSTPSAANLLQPSDRHILITDGFTLPSKGFSSKAAPLYNAQLIQDAHPDVTEVFSWERNPQRWHVLKRSATLNCGPLTEGDVYLEVSRKDTSLMDVDNVLAGVIRKSGLISQ